MRIGGARGLQPVGIFLGVAELQRVFATLGMGSISKPGSSSWPEPRIGPDAPVMFAFRADAEVRLVFLVNSISWH
jgi:hypothetical protein